MTEDEELNVLTVVANESYREYAAQLQREYAHELGPGQQITVRNARRKRTVAPKPGFADDPHFQALWQRINQRTRYRVALDSEALIGACVAELRQIDVQPVSIHVSVDRLAEMRGDFVTNRRIMRTPERIELDRSYTVPDVPALLAERTHLTRATLSRMLLEAGTLSQITTNPAAYVDRAAEIISRVMRRQLVEGIRYEKVERFYDMTLFQPFEGYADSDGAADGNLLAVEKSIYDYVLCDSGVERQFAEALERIDGIKLFLKLPREFKIPTPLGAYNPDWAILYHHTDAGEERLALYLVRETKGSLHADQLRDSEKLKISCSKQHFEQFPEVDYDVATGDIHAPKDFLNQLESLVATTRH